MTRSLDVQAALRLVGLIGALLATSCRVYDGGLLAPSGTGPRDRSDYMTAADGGASPGTDGEVVPSIDAGLDRADAGKAGEAGTTATSGTTGSASAGGTAGSAAGSAGTMAANMDDDAGTLLTDPLGCPEANGGVWSRNGHCYFPLNVASTWYQSRDRCRELGAQLVTIASAQEQAFVGTLIGEAPRWIGLSRFGAPTFGWIDGAGMTFENWEPGAPSTAMESAVLVRNDTLLWFDDPVSQSHPALCERILPK